MKYLKLFESEDLDPNGEFVKGDWLLVDISTFSNNDGLPDDAGDKAYGTFILYKGSPESSYNYSVKVYFEDDIRYFGFDRDEIIRKLTPKEIEDFEMKLQAKKYNL